MNRKALITMIVSVFMLFAGITTSMMLKGRRNRVEVCMKFNGQTSCKIGAGPTSEASLRTATEAACALIAFGVTDSQQCTSSQPLSVRWLK